ncbi:uncharacterized protein B0I36DRAFT_319302 [Microdochium trichocladiopsis]|uniref:DUF7730 domain-containing protein n=1 Tax=Microdochium trichocladiopsis TaxID=1682393 RepID=A0A9P8YCR8_9PEZI|nr:uncharacterized protein B0I36DRAFT_319302 [Microdochium trichocladiopsis]KAH7035887.1 hypothetical protein B0I36DRAFT_319302 [Microdochium trichocladiopsis]
MAPPTIRQPNQPLQCVIDNWQLESSFFGKLPAEIRQLIYKECWLASGPQQHIFLRQGQHSTHASEADGSGKTSSYLTHFPCCKTSEDDEEILAEHDHIVEAKRQSRSRSSAYFVDEVWSSRFNSPWLDHWRCEEAMMEESLLREFEHSSGVKARQRTLFMPFLLCCRRMYHEALASIYASTTFIYTDLAAAHRALVSLSSPTAPLVQSLGFSLALPYDILHQHRYYSSPGAQTGPWAELCVALSNMARFSALKSAVIRLDLAGGDTRATGLTSVVSSHSNNTSSPSPGALPSRRSSLASLDNTPVIEHEDRMWWQVRERWILSPIRGMLARRLTVHLPERRRRIGPVGNRRGAILPTTNSSPPSSPLTSSSTPASVHSSRADNGVSVRDSGVDQDDSPEWMWPYQYREGDATPFILQRYRRCRLPRGGVVINRSCSGSGPPSPRSLLRSWSSASSTDGSSGPSSPVRNAHAGKPGPGKGDAAATKTVQRALNALIKGRSKE